VYDVESKDLGISVDFFYRKGCLYIISEVWSALPIPISTEHPFVPNREWWVVQNRKRGIVLDMFVCQCYSLPVINVVLLSWTHNHLSRSIPRARPVSAPPAGRVGISHRAAASPL
jgi:hypothetical protein